jgi:hypothetical protein
MEHVGSGIRALAAHLQGPLQQQTSPPKMSRTAPDPGSALGDVGAALEFHRRMATIIAAVQSGVWSKGVHELLGYATDFGLGQQRGVQTLVLKTRGRSAYVRLPWDTVMSDIEDDRRRVADQVESAIRELA